MVRLFVCLLVTSFLLVACTPTAGQSGTSASGGGQQAPDEAFDPQEEPLPADDTAGQTSPQLPDEENLPAEADVLPEEDATGPIDTSGWEKYENREFGFAIAHPADFVVDEVSQPEAQLLPPVAEFLFQPPESAQADIAIPDLSIRLFQNPDQNSLEAWVQTNDIALTEDGWHMERYDTAGGISGIIVYTEQLIAPGWYVYLANGRNVYQLTPYGKEAEKMLETFQFTE